MSEIGDPDAAGIDDLRVFLIDQARYTPYFEHYYYNKRNFLCMLQTNLTYHLAHRSYVATDINGDALIFHVEERNKELEKQEQLSITHLRCLVQTCRTYSEQLGADEWFLVPISQTHKSTKKVC